MPRKNFLRRTWNRYSRLGKRKKKKQKWRRPTGRHNKMREKRKGYPAVVGIGYKQEKKLRGTINEKIPKQIMNIKDLEKLKENEIAILGGVGKKKKIEIAKKARENKIEIYNLNIKKFLEKAEKKINKIKPAPSDSSVKNKKNNLSVSKADKMQKENKK